MAKTPIWLQTKREKLGTIDGINLFFGALLGANLGTLGAIELIDYAYLIILLAGLVMTIRLVHLSDRRGYALASHILYLFLIGLFLFVPALRPDGLADGDRDRLAVTIAVWVAMTLGVEFYPIGQDEKEA